MDLGKRCVRLMVIENEHVRPETLGSRQRFEARRAAVDRHDQLRAFFDECFDGGGVRPITFEDAVGNIDAGWRAMMIKEARQQCRRAGAIDIVVAENCNRRARRDRIC